MKLIAQEFKVQEQAKDNNSIQVKQEDIFDDQGISIPNKYQESVKKQK